MLPEPFYQGTRLDQELEYVSLEELQAAADFLDRILGENQSGNQNPDADGPETMPETMPAFSAGPPRKTEPA